jgi:hypothetical protein
MAEATTDDGAYEWGISRCLTDGQPHQSKLAAFDTCFCRRCNPAGVLSVLQSSARTRPPSRDLTHAPACVRAKDPKARAKTEGWTVTEFETHVQSQLLNLRQQLDAAVASDEPDQVASLSFQLDDLQRLSRDNRR